MKHNFLQLQATPFCRNAHIAKNKQLDKQNKITQIAFFLMYSEANFDKQL